MTAENWGEIFVIYEAACQVPASGREEYLLSALADPERRRQVRHMLETLDVSSGDADDIGNSTFGEAAPAPTPALPPGTAVGRFTLGERLGRGGMGEVYAARDPELDREVALKILPEAGNKRVLRSPGDFTREARAAAALNHPNIVTVHEVLRWNESIVTVMELVHGKTLRRLRREPVAPVELAGWGKQMADALAAAHRLGILHRDIKPENLMVRADGYVKILDFGLAQKSDQASAGAGHLPVGTICYMSPEQTRGESLTGASDVFSLGVVLYELATQSHPFQRDSLTETIERICAHQPESARRRNPAIPSDFDALIQAMLRKNPAARPSAEAVARQLAAQGGERKRRWLPAVVASLAFAALAWWGSRVSEQDGEIRR